MDATVKETGGQASPHRSLMYKRETSDSDLFITSDDNSPAIKKSINVEKEMSYSVKSKFTHIYTDTDIQLNLVKLIE